MLATRLVRLIEEHAEDLTRGVLHELQTHPRTPAYHKLDSDELYRRVFDVYSHLGRWLDEKDDSRLEGSYGDLGRRRRTEGIPLSEVVQALVLTKNQLRSFIRSESLGDSAVQLYQEEELHVLIENFFDKAVYHTVRGYESARA